MTRYPAIFVDDILVATPKDFGFYGKGEGENAGRYAPWRDARSHERFRADLSRMLNQVLDGKREALRSELEGPGSPRRGPSPCPPCPLSRLRRWAAARWRALGSPANRCWSSSGPPGAPPCRGTLAWLGELERRYGDRLEVVALAIESDPDDVRKVVAGMSPRIHWAMASPELALQFGDLSAVPTLFLFDAAGGTRQGLLRRSPRSPRARRPRALASLTLRGSPRRPGRKWQGHRVGVRRPSLRLPGRCFPGGIPPAGTIAVIPSS